MAIAGGELLSNVAGFYTAPQMFVLMRRQANGRQTSGAACFEDWRGALRVAAE